MTTPSHTLGFSCPANYTVQPSLLLRDRRCHSYNQRHYFTPGHGRSSLADDDSCPVDPLLNPRHARCSEAIGLKIGLDVAKECNGLRSEPPLGKADGQ